MKAEKSLLFLSVLLLFISCGPREQKPLLDRFKREPSPEYIASIPLDKGFSEFISGYTSGVVSTNAVIEIRFTPAFAAKADTLATGLFTFEPSIKGKTEWKDGTTLVFTPSRLLEPGKTYTGGLNLNKIESVPDRLKIFPLRIQVLKKDFRITIGELNSSAADGSTYELNGQIIASDFMETREVEDLLKARLGRKRMDIAWDHSENLVHKYKITGIGRTDEAQELTLSWDGNSSGIRQKGSNVITIPPSGEFKVIDVISQPGENQKIDIIFSDPLEASQETDGLVQLKPAAETTINLHSNIISLFPASRLQGEIILNVEAGIKNSKGATMASSFVQNIDFTAIPPGIKTEGKGVIVPSSKNLVFPFKAVNLKAVDLRIVRIFDNNLPYFLQENDLTGSNSLARFGRPVYSGRIDLVTNPGMNTGTWNLYTVDLADYIDIEPGVLYKVTLGMRKSYSLYPCGSEEGPGKYEEMLKESEMQERDNWDDPQNYYSNSEDEIYYSFDFDWRDHDNPCKDAYYYPGRGATRNILASNIGLIAKKGEDNILHAGFLPQYPAGFSTWCGGIVQNCHSTKLFILTKRRRYIHPRSCLNLQFLRHHAAI